MTRRLTPSLHCSGKGSDWFNRRPRKLPRRCVRAPVAEAITLPKKANKDILDVWWDQAFPTPPSAVTATTSSSLPIWRLEGSDQHRSWFMSSLMTSVGAYGTAPYKAVVSGFTLDSQGRKMSKSLGNVIDLEQGMRHPRCRRHAPVGLSVDTSNDVTCDGGISHVGEAYRKIRNTLRFLLGEIEGRFDPATDAVATEELAGYDKLALAVCARYTRS